MIAVFQTLSRDTCKIVRVILYTVTLLSLWVPIVILLVDPMVLMSRLKFYTRLPLEGVVLLAGILLPSIGIILLLSALENEVLARLKELETGKRLLAHLDRRGACEIVTLTAVMVAVISWAILTIAKPARGYEPATVWAQRCTFLVVDFVLLIAALVWNITIADELERARVGN